MNALTEKKKIKETMGLKWKENGVASISAQLNLLIIYYFIQF